MPTKTELEEQVGRLEKQLNEMIEAFRKKAQDANNLYDTLAKTRNELLEVNVKVNRLTAQVENLENLVRGSRV